MNKKITLADGRTTDIDYFVEWRPFLWRRPLLDSLRFLGDLTGKRVLEIGGRSGRITSLFAMLGANVTMLQRGEVKTATIEVEKQGVSDHVRLFETNGGFRTVASEKFDVIFTKSVLWCVEHLDGFLSDLDAHLADDGKVAFLENVKGGNFIQWLRRMIRRGDFEYEQAYFGITPRQLPLFKKHFSNLKVVRRRHFVYEIFGHKKTASVGGGDAAGTSGYASSADVGKGQ